MLLGVAFGPFLQQVLTFPSVFVEQPSQNSTVKKSVGVFTLPYSRNTIGALSKVMWNFDFQQTPRCTAADCNWDSFQSIGWYHKCENVAATIEPNCSAYFTATELGNQTSDYTRTCEFTMDGQPGRYSFNITASGYNFTNGLGWQLWTTMPLSWTWEMKNEDPQLNIPWMGGSTYIGVKSPAVAVGSVNGTG